MEFGQKIEIALNKRLLNAKVYIENRKCFYIFSMSRKAIVTKQYGN